MLERGNRAHMLVDYHMHLEEDDWTGPCRYNVDRIREYVAVAQQRGVDEIGISEHCHRFPQFRPVMEHLLEPEPVPGAFWLPDNFNQALDDYVEAVLQAQAAGLPVKLGIEVDYIPGKVDEIRSILEPYPWDYVIGSVHFLDDWAIDVSPDLGWPGKDVDEVYAAYFERLGEAIGSGLFDIIAHPDLIKKFGHRPSYDLVAVYERLTSQLKEAGVVLELSSAGLRKPVGEPYPADVLLTMCARAQVPVTLGSDAHRPEDVGAGFDRLVSMARRCGYRELAVFYKREMCLVSLSNFPL